ncbi:MAG: tRNA (adenosine(37)-N6)-threonylcarbamoyltransferase complex dimerization subunit type 1 TsaB [Candidatus Omnitrophica bacterium]|nr:tRNA (adenosine(37)-N6)-threonylcarbamoyltransferase complex dimerization subunit type 1 TsaB [Candidatus Omnitrophota bacterium]
MKILALDTSTKFLTLGLYGEEKFYDYNIDLGRKHSSLLAPTIKRVIGALGWKIQEIDYFACGLGPGSFTGVRIGVSTIKGMAFAKNQPVVGISTLDILARNAPKEFSRKEIVPVLDARRGLLYYSIYAKVNSRLRRMIPYRLATKKKFFKEVRSGSIILGDGLECCLEELHRNSKGMTLLDKDYWYPKANQLVRLAQERIKEGKFCDSSKIKPIYLYPKECQIR